ncbi:hypothetical protein [Paeniglutamicibacter terrestris]|uniref:Phage tail protein n=1 Tax=Paeniglutamicibacter terrestris TaxID=2723403 RepID=A0ABX1G578_9MICC|nr:hypothetical protein [Paeniglutamicibacter terrestris]NKG21114.1 hypothetical protein [Paeniglutamicibacter terrestris]
MSMTTRVVFGSAAGESSRPSPWIKTRMWWTGADGERRELTDPESGVFVMPEGIEGLGNTGYTPWLSQSPAQHGQRFRGGRYEPRPCFWPVMVYSRVSTTAWFAEDTDFWRSMVPDVYGVWEVQTPSGTRRLTCRFEGDGNHKFDYDPGRRGWTAYGVALTADDPFWYGESITQEWEASTSQDLNAWTAGSQLGFLSSANRLEDATITNTGDLEAWPVWTIHGPMTSATVGVAGRTVTAPITLATSNDVLVIDTDPTVQMAWKNGVDVTSSLGTANFAPIPAGENRKLQLSLVGTGAVAVELRPRFRRAW